jgi:hypothetical protein
MQRRVRLDSGKQRELDHYQFRKFRQRERSGQLHRCGEQQFQPTHRDGHGSRADCHGDTRYG